MADYFDSCPKIKCMSTVGVRTDLYPKVHILIVFFFFEHFMLNWSEYMVESGVKKLA